MSCPRNVVEVSCDKIIVVEIGTVIEAGGGSIQEVFFQDTDPTVTYPAINFKAGLFPAHPLVATLRVFEP